MASEAEELCFRLVWLTRLRWLGLIAVLAMLGILRLWSSPALELAPLTAWLLVVVCLNLGYHALLHRIQAAAAEHERWLQRLAHAQIVGDLVANSVLFYF